MIFDKIKLKDVAIVVRNNFTILTSINEKLDRIINYLYLLEARLAEYGIELEKRNLH